MATEVGPRPLVLLCCIFVLIGWGSVNAIDASNAMYMSEQLTIWPLRAQGTLFVDVVLDDPTRTGIRDGKIDGSADGEIAGRYVMESFYDPSNFTLPDGIAAVDVTVNSDPVEEWVLMAMHTGPEMRDGKVFARHLLPFGPGFPGLQVQITTDEGGDVDELVSKAGPWLSRFLGLGEVGVEWSRGARFHPLLLNQGRVQGDPFGHMEGTGVWEGKTNCRYWYYPKEQQSGVTFFTPRTSTSPSSMARHIVDLKEVWQHSKEPIEWTTSLATRISIQKKYGDEINPELFERRDFESDKMYTRVTYMDMGFASPKTTAFQFSALMDEQATTHKRNLKVVRQFPKRGFSYSDFFPTPPIPELEGLAEVPEVPVREVVQEQEAGTAGEDDSISDDSSGEMEEAQDDSSGEMEEAQDDSSGEMEEAQDDDGPPPLTLEQEQLLALKASILDSLRGGRPETGYSALQVQNRYWRANIRRKLKGKKSSDGQGSFHRVLRTEIDLIEPPMKKWEKLPQLSCELLLLEMFPPDVYVDLYEMAQVEEMEDGPKVVSFHDIDLEKPTSSPDVFQEVFAVLKPVKLSGPTVVEVDMKVHMRYNDVSSNDTHAKVELYPPLMYLKCASSVRKVPQNNDFFIPLYESILTTLAMEPKIGAGWDIVLPMSYHSDNVVTAKVPVGNSNHSVMVYGVTLGVTVVAVVVVSYLVWIKVRGGNKSKEE